MLFNNEIIPELRAKVTHNNNVKIGLRFPAATQNLRNEMQTRT